MAKFQCSDADDHGGWADVEAYDAEEAAEKHAATMDADNGGEIFRNPHTDKLRVRVKCGAAAPQVYEITFDYSKDFYSHLLEIEHAEND